MRSILKISILALFVLTLVGCKKSDIKDIDLKENDFAIAEIDTLSKVMVSDLYNRLLKSRLLIEGGYLDSSTYFDTLQSIVIDSLASLEAKNIRVEDNWLQYRLFRDDFRQRYVNYLFDKIIVDKLNIDSADVVEYYNTNLDSFKKPQQFRVSHLLISRDGLRFGPDSASYKIYTNDQLDSIAPALVTKYRAMIDSVTTFAVLAEQYSLHFGSKNQGGDLGFFTRNTYAPEFEDVVCTLSVGNISQPFETRDGWHIAQLTDFVDSSTATLDEVYEQAYKRVEADRARDKSMAFIDSIGAAAQYKFNDEALSKPASIVDDTVWAVIVNGRDTINHYRLSDYFYDFKKAIRRDSLTLDDEHLALMRLAGPYVISEAGDDMGYGNDSVIVAEKKALYHRYALKILGSKSSDPGYEPDPETVREYYEKHLDDYIIQKPVYVQHIIVEDSIFGEFLRDQALSGIDFLDLAREHYPGAEEIRVAAADLGYIGPDEMPEDFYQTAMRTGKGDVSHPVKTEWGYHIIHVVDKKLNKTFEQVKSQIGSKLRKEHQTEVRSKWQEDLMNSHKVVYHLKMLKKLPLPPLKER